MLKTHVVCCFPDKQDSRSGMSLLKHGKPLSEEGKVDGWAHKASVFDTGGQGLHLSFNHDHNLSLNLTE